MSGPSPVWNRQFGSRRMFTPRSRWLLDLVFTILGVALFYGGIYLVPRVWP